MKLGIKRSASVLAATTHMRHGDYSPDEDRLIYDSSVSDVLSIVSDTADNGEATMSSELVSNRSY